MKRLRSFAVLFVAVVALAAAVSSASAAEQEGPFFQVNTAVKVHKCFKAPTLGNYPSLTDCEKDERFKKLGHNPGWLQGCEQRIGVIGIYATEADCLDFTNPVFVLNGWSPLILLKGLAAGSTRLLLVSAKENFTLDTKGVGIAIKCTGLKLPEGSQMQIQGVAAGNGGISKEVLEFTGCTQTGNGTPCEVESEKFKTNALLNLLGYPNSSRTGSVLVLFEPETSKKFGNVRFVGAGCTVAETAVEGTVVGGARVSGLPVVIGAEPELTLHGEITFPHPQLIFIEKGGSLKHVKAGLTAFGLSTTLSGTELVQVDEGGVPVPWGIYT